MLLQLPVLHVKIDVSLDHNCKTGFTLITSIARQCCLTHESSRMCNWYCSHWSMPCRRSPCNGAACLFGWGRQAPRYDGAAAGYTKYSPTVVYFTDSNLVYIIMNYADSPICSVCVGQIYRYRLCCLNELQVWCMGGGRRTKTLWGSLNDESVL